MSWVGRHATFAWLIGIGVAVLTIVATVFLGVIPLLERYHDLTIKNQVQEDLREPLQKFDAMTVDIATIKGTLNAWAPFITPQFFKKSVALSQTDFEKALPQLKAVAQISSMSQTLIPTGDIAEVGKRTINLASGKTESANLAWETTAALLQYRSVVNVSDPPKGLDTAKPLNSQDFTTRYSSYWEPGLTGPSLAAVRTLVPHALAAAMDSIGQDQNKDLPVGPALLVARGGSITLDKMHLRSVVLINMHVIYKGSAPVILENVYFLNCTFQITNDSRGIQLASQILTTTTPATSTSIS